MQNYPLTFRGYIPWVADRETMILEDPEYNE
jgi:hypothetical protein